IESCAIKKIGHLSPRRVTSSAENAWSKVPLQPLGLFDFVTIRPACHNHCVMPVKQVPTDLAPAFGCPAVDSLPCANLHDGEIGQIAPQFPDLGQPSVKLQRRNR